MKFYFLPEDFILLSDAGKDDFGVNKNNNM
jgi:hypothetical protein